ncbi:MAG: transposase [Armatimonadota bacterium]
MAQSFSQVLVHGVFSTKDRAPWIDKDIEPELFAYLATVLKSKGHTPLIVGGHEDHVHFLCGLSRIETISKMIENAKVASSKWMKTTGGGRENFSWQRGYGAFRISYSARNSVMDYIANQEAHHSVTSFQDEFRKLLEEHGIPYDEKYVWN